MLANTFELKGPKELTIVENEILLDSTDSILAKTAYTAISTGTELAAWLGKPPLRPSTIYPRLMGYCNIAQIIEVGSEVSELSAGDWILTHQSHSSHFGVKVCDVLCHFSAIKNEEAKRLSTTYLFHLGYAALLKGKFFPGCRVAIIGLGVLGYTSASLVNCFGGKATVFSGKANSFDFLDGKGFIVKSKESVSDHEKVFDLVINTSDSWDDYLASLKLLRAGGVVVLLGFPGRGLNLPDFNPMESSLLYDKQLTITYAGYMTELELPEIDVRFTLKRNMQYLSNLILESRLDVSPLCSFVSPWKDLASVYDLLNERRTKSLTGVLEWN